MAKIQDKDPRFKNLELKVGALVAAAIIGIVAVVIFVGMEKDLFTKKYNLYFVSDSGAGFMEGMPVKLSGFKIGRVTDIELGADANVRITAQLNRKYEKWVRKDSVARLSKEGFIGDSFIEIAVGDPAEKVLADGEAITFEKTGGMEEIVNEARPILVEVKEIIHYINSPEGDLKQALGNVNSLFAELRETRRSLDETIRSANSLVLDIKGKSGPAFSSVEKITKNIEAVTMKLDPVMTKAEAAVSGVEQTVSRLPATLDRVDGILSDVRAVTGPLSRESGRISNILIDAEGAARDGKTVLKGVKESWPVKLMVPPPQKPGLVPLDGTFFYRGDDEKK